MYRGPKFKCPDCHKQLDELDMVFVPGVEGFLIGYGSYDTGKNYCRKCSEVYLGKISSEEREILSKVSPEELKKEFQVELKERLPSGEIIVVAKPEFTFDEEGYRLFSEEFCSKDYKILLINGYMARKRLKDEKGIKGIDFFHRWYMERLGEVKKFADANNLKDWAIHVHHQDGKKENNCFSNLLCKESKVHVDDHEKQKSLKIFKEVFNSSVGGVSEDKILEIFNSWWNKTK